MRGEQHARDLGRTQPRRALPPAGVVAERAPLRGPPRRSCSTSPPSRSTRASEGTSSEWSAVSCTAVPERLSTARQSPSPLCQRSAAANSTVEPHTVPPPSSATAAAAATAAATAAAAAAEAALALLVDQIGLGLRMPAALVHLVPAGSRDAITLKWSCRSRRRRSPPWPSYTQQAWTPGASRPDWDHAHVLQVRAALVAWRTFSRPGHRFDSERRRVATGPGCTAARRRRPTPCRAGARRPTPRRACARAAPTRSEPACTRLATPLGHVLGAPWCSTVAPCRRARPARRCARRAPSQDAGRRHRAGAGPGGLPSDRSPSTVTVWPKRRGVYGPSSSPGSHIVCGGCAQRRGELRRASSGDDRDEAARDFAAASVTTSARRPVGVQPQNRPRCSHASVHAA